MRLAHFEELSRSHDHQSSFQKGNIFSWWQIQLFSSNKILWKHNFLPPPLSLSPRVCVHSLSYCYHQRCVCVLSPFYHQLGGSFCKQLPFSAKMPCLTFGWFTRLPLMTIVSFCHLDKDKTELCFPSLQQSHILPQGPENILLPPAPTEQCLKPAFRNALCHPSRCTNKSWANPSQMPIECIVLSSRHVLRKIMVAQPFNGVLLTCNNFQEGTSRFARALSDFQVSH